MDQVVVGAEQQSQIEINSEIEMIKQRFRGFTEERCPWISERRAAGNAVSVRTFRHVLCGTITSRRARRTVTRILRDASIMTHAYIIEDEEDA